MNSLTAIILAGGYAKRLWPLTVDKPKALLQVNGQPIVQHILQKITELNDVKDIIISTNLKFAPHFKEWLEHQGYNNISLITDNSNSEEEKPGAVTALAHITSKIDENCLIIAGDNLFTSSLLDMKRRFLELDSPLVGVYDVKSLGEARKYAAVSLDKDGRIVNLVEKPLNPDTTLAAVCIYMLLKRTLPMIEEYADRQMRKDELGRLIEWLSKKEKVYGYKLNGSWWDIGSKENYLEAVQSLNSQIK